MSQMVKGQAITELCKRLVPEEDDSALLSKLQQLFADYPVRLARTGKDWYKLGGIVDQSGQRVAHDITEWAERTYLETGHNFDALVEYATESQLIATKRIGCTLYFVVETGHRAEDYLLFEIEKTREIADRLVINEDVLPEDLEEIIDPLIPAQIESHTFGQSRYQYRRKTDMSLFLKSLTEHYADQHPVNRFINDWNRSSAFVSGQIFCRDWFIRPYQHTGRYGEQVVNAEIISLQTKQLPHLEDLVGKQGTSLNNLLVRFDRQAGYPFAWFFYMVKGTLVSPHNGEAVYRDLTGDFSYLPKRDEAVLRDWIATPYNL